MKRMEVVKVEVTFKVTPQRGLATFIAKEARRLTKEKKESWKRKIEAMYPKASVQLVTVKHHTKLLPHNGVN